MDLWILGNVSYVSENIGNFRHSQGVVPAMNGPKAEQTNFRITVLALAIPAQFMVSGFCQPADVPSALPAPTGAYAVGRISTH